MTASNHSSVRRDWIPTFFLISVFLLVAPFALRPFYDEIRLSLNWKGVLQNYQDVGEHCKVSMQQPVPSQSLEQMLEIGRSTAVDYKLPFRREPKHKSLPDNSWVYFKCEIVAEQVEKLIAPALYLGPIWGKTTVLVNGSVRRKYPAYSFITIPLEQEEVQKAITLEAVSINDKKSAGPMSLVPMVIVPSDLDVRKIDRDMYYYRTESTLVPLGIAGTMAALFLSCWLFGVRYRDVYWMTITAVLAAWSAALNLDPNTDAPLWLTRLGYAAHVACWISFFNAIYTYLRHKAEQRTLIALVVGGTLLYMCQLVVPPEWRKATIGQIGRYDGVIFGPTLIYLGYLASRINDHIPPRRHFQRLLLAGILYLLGSFVLLDGLFGYRIGISSENISRTTLIGVFGIFVMVDLVIFQRAYFEEKSLKEEEERRRTALEERMELGFSIQRLLMPGSTATHFGPFKVHVLFECADKMAGDWFYWKEYGDELRVLCGDVVGKGPEAAIAATSILTLCHNFVAREVSLHSAIAEVNSNICEMFNNTNMSTLGAATLHKSGVVHVFNHGFSGWFHVPRNLPTKVLLQRGPSLGVEPKTRWDSLEVKMGPGDRLVIFSDGVAEGPRAIKKIVEALTMSHGLSMTELESKIMEIGRSSVVDDDRTIVVIEHV
jgi:hypothetical protein